MNTNTPYEPTRDLVDVGIGIVLRLTPNIHQISGTIKSPPPEQGGIDSPAYQILITQRPDHTVFGGYWELPGGKLDPGETPDQAVVRELHEEVGIHAEVTHALSDVEHLYPHAHVRLHPRICRLAKNSPEPRPLHVDDFTWCDTTALHRYEFPPANDTIVAELLQYIDTLTPPS